MTTSSLEIRAEIAADYPAVHALNCAAFDTHAEARLVDHLRHSTAQHIALVAQSGEALLGYILFTPVSLSTAPQLSIMGLAPMAVQPDQQGSGIGSLLVTAGLRCCAEAGAGAVVVLGHPGYYPRFGFLPASRFGLGCNYDVPDEVFMAQELVAGYLAEASGMISYHPDFDAV